MRLIPPTDWWNARRRPGRPRAASPGTWCRRAGARRTTPSRAGAARIPLNRAAMSCGFLLVAGPAPTSDSRIGLLVKPRTWPTAEPNTLP